MKKIKLILIPAIIIILSISCFSACAFLPDLDVEDMFEEVGDLFGDIFGSNHSPYDDCKKGNHQWYYSWSEEPTCFYEGYAYYNCHVCGDQRRETLPRLDHEIVKESGYDATCYSYGYTGNYYCVYCGEITEYGTEIQPLGHQNTVIENQKDVTCTENGYTGDEVCLDCGSIISYGNTIYYNGHPNTYIINAVEPDCYNSGYSGDEVCTDCGEIVWYGYYLEPCHNNITIINAVEATCTSEGYSGDGVCNDCGETVYYGDYYTNGGHSYDYYYGVDATCTEDGYTSGYYCYRCESFFEGHEVIPAYGHSEYIYSYGQTGDCYNDGWSDCIACSRCGDILQESEYIPAGHKEVEIPAIEATCSTYGYTEGSKCSVCGVTIQEQTRIDMLKHSEIVYVEGHEATCTSDGLTSGEACAVCGTPTKTQHSIPATGHIFGDDNKCYSCDLFITDCISYTLYNNEYMVNGFISGKGNDVSVLVIPPYYNGYPVTTIVSDAFSGYENLTQVVIPGTVSYIENRAFYNCPNLQSVELMDYNQCYNSFSNWLVGCDNAKISAIVYNGMSPYEVYLAAMKVITHNLDRYAMTTDGVTYMNYYGTSYKSVSTKMVQKQYYNNFYIYKSSTDHMSSSAQTIEEYYYVNEYLYTNIAGFGNAKFYCSPEAFSGLFLIESGDLPQFTAKYFNDARFVVNDDGTMNLTLVMDEELIAELITNIGNIQADMTVYDCTYSYKFDADGNIISYTSVMNYGINNYDYTFTAESTTSFSDIGTLGEIYAPSGYTDVSSALSNSCKNGHTVVECPETPATCYGNGKTAYSYCKACYAAIVSYEVLEAGHDYVNGECTICGEFYGQTSGLAYMLNAEGTGYILIGIGDCKDTFIYVPQQIYGRPVVSVSGDAFEGTDVIFINVGNGGNWYINEFNGCDNAMQYWDWE